VWDSIRLIAVSTKLSLWPIATDLKLNGNLGM